jgi:hypothetical protein
LADGPTIVLIGGEMTLEEGGRVDSRQTLQGDDWDFVLRAALTRSERWWDEARKLADAILKHDGEGSWALIWAPKTILRYRGGGEAKRIRIASVFPGIRSLHEFETGKRGPVGSVIDADACGGQYRLFGYPLRFEDLEAFRPPSVFVGGHPTLASDSYSVRPLLPFDVVLHKWPNTVLVQPHTPLTERSADDLVRWYELGRRLRPEKPPRGLGADDQIRWYQQAEMDRASDRPRFDQFIAAATAFRHHKPVVLDADFQVTRFIDSGSEAIAADLAAAGDFVAGRFDLDIGLWDLARDPLLRRTLLEPEEHKQPTGGAVEIPPDLTAAAAESKRAWVQQRQEDEVSADARMMEEAARRAALHASLWPILKAEGWEIEPGMIDSKYVLPLGPNVRIHQFVDERPLLYYAIHIHKGHCVLRLLDALQHLFRGKVAGCVQKNTSVINGITGRDPKDDIVLRLPRHGWAGESHDWATSLDLMNKVVEALEPSVFTLSEEAASVLGRHLAEWPVEQPTTNKPRGGFFRRIFGD